MRKPAVDILMAVYNGERYLSEQIASLQAQTHKDWRLLVADDGSSDGTVELLQSIARDDPRICVLDRETGNLGPCRRFLWLVGKASADYILFADQDDVWDPTKVETLLDTILREEDEHGSTDPIAVFCDAEVVDERLDTIAPSFLAYEHFDPAGIDLRHLLVNNVAPGCTMIVNRALADALELPADPTQVIMHDWWLLLTAAALGTVAFVDKPLLKYRQHGGNASGAGGFGVLRYLPLVRRVAEAHQRSQRQALAFLQAYSRRLSSSDLELCHAYATMGHRGLRPALTIARYGLWQPGLARRAAQVMLPIICPLSE